MRIQIKDASWDPTQDVYADFFRCVAAKRKMRRLASVEDTLRVLDESAVSSSIVWDTVHGKASLERSEIQRVAREALRANTLGLVSPEASVKEAQKADLVTTFKEALKFLDTEMKKIQKDLGEETPAEQIFEIAYGALQDTVPEFCVIWDKFTLIKGLNTKGWKVRARSEPVAKSPYHDKVLEFQQRLGPKLGGMEFQSMSEGLRGVLSLHYGSAERGLNLHFWYAPVGSAYEVNVEQDGKIVSTFRENNSGLLDPFLDMVASSVCERWSSISKTGANSIAPDEIDTSLPEALGPDRSGWTQLLMQVFHSTRDFLRHQVRFLPTKMILWRDQYSGDTFEHHMRGDESDASVLIRGSLSLGGSPVFHLECIYGKSGRSHTTTESFDLSQYDATSDLVADVQEYLSGCLDRELTQLRDQPSTLRNVLQKAIRQGF